MYDSELQRHILVRLFDKRNDRNYIISEKDFDFPVKPADLKRALGQIEDSNYAEISYTRNEAGEREIKSVHITSKGIYYVEDELL